MQASNAGFSSAVWPVLTRYSNRELLRVAMPLGGIGTGTLSLGGRGDLRDWEVMNRPAKGFYPLAFSENGPFFAVCTFSADGKTHANLLEGPFDPSEYEGPGGIRRPNHGLPRFRDCEFLAAYPLAQVKLSSPGFPLAITLKAFNPLVPADSAASSLPFVSLRYTVRNVSTVTQTVTLCGTVPNFIGMDGREPSLSHAGWLVFKGVCANRNRWREQDGLRGIYMYSVDPDQSAETWGTMALSTPDVGRVTKRLNSLPNQKWNGALRDLWEDFTQDGRLDERPDAQEDRPVGSLALTRDVAPGEDVDFRFLLSWHFPNRHDWTPEKHRRPNSERTRIGNHYGIRFQDAWDVARQVVGQLAELEQRTVDFVSAFVNSDLPASIKEAALYNVSTLRTQTCFQTPDGMFFGFEGGLEHAGSCYGSCTHVWNYEQATAFLFGDLARTMRRVEFEHATDERGMMNFRVNLPIEEACEFGKAAADGQMGCIMKLYREWQLSGDSGFLRSLWPHAKRCLEFCWMENGWDADRDGVMEGCQHNTMDVEYFGPNPQMTGWYLGALKAAERMAAHLGDETFAATCARLFASGSAWMDKNLFNGQYYIHKVEPPTGQVPECLYGQTGARDMSCPDYQLGEGCLIDQMAGQYMAHVCGLGYLHRPEYVKRALQTVFSLNRKPNVFDHFNPMRSFAVGDEAALFMVAYPNGKREKVPFPYYGESMTGFEYTAAVGMLYEGLTEEGLRCIGDIRRRFDGAKRNPFNEAECGYHYARAMASWAAVVAWTGFRYSAVDKTFEVGRRPGRYFWSTGRAWGIYRLDLEVGAGRLELRVMGGCLDLERIGVGGDFQSGTWRQEQGSLLTVVFSGDEAPACGTKPPQK